jgi:hypothetical protein
VNARTRESALQTTSYSGLVFNAERNRCRRLVGVVGTQNRPRATSPEDVHAHLFGAILDQRLPPGTKLTEAMLVETFDLGRRAIGEGLLVHRFRISPNHANRSFRRKTTWEARIICPEVHHSPRRARMGDG